MKSCGVIAADGGYAVINGTLTAPDMKYIMLQSNVKMPSDFTSDAVNHTHYKIYSDSNSNMVLLKNTEPAAKAMLPDLSVVEGNDITFAASDIAEDADNDALTITGIADYPNSSIASASLAGGAVTITGISAGNTSVTVTVSDNVDEIDISLSITVSPAPNPPVITTQPSSQTVTAGNTVTFTVEAAGDLPLTYRWQKDGIDLADGEYISGATSSTLTIVIAREANEGSYSVIVANSYGTVMSNEATLTVNPVTDPACEIGSIQFETLTDALSTIRAGEAKTIKLLKDINHNGFIEIDSKTITIDTNGHTLNVTNDTLPIIDVYNNGALNLDTTTGGSLNVIYNRDSYYEYAIEIADGGSMTVSNITINGSCTAAAGVYDNGFLRVTGNISLTGIECLGIDAWNYGTVEVDGSIYLNTENTSSIRARYGGYVYIGGGISITGNSNQIMEVCTPGSMVYIEGNVSITGPYSDGIIIYYGGTAVIKGTYTAPSDYYVFLEDTYKTPSEYTADTASYPNYKIYSDAYGNTFRLKNNAPAAKGTIPVQTVSASNTTSFTASDIAVDADNDTLTITAITAGPNTSIAETSLDIGTVTITGKAAGSTAVTVTVSDGVDIVNVTVNINVTAFPDAPSITTQPASQTVSAGQTVTFSVTASGNTPLSYQWYKNDAALTDDSRINGATSSTLIITDVQESDAGRYTVTVTNNTGSAISSEAVLTVNPAPVAPIITTSTLPDGMVNTSYNQALTATGDTPITWSIESGSLPNGLTLSPGGVISGTPTAAGTFSFVVKAANIAGDNTKSFTIVIDSAAPYIPPAPALHTINASAGNGGTISPSGSITVQKGGILIFTITPNKDYAISSITVDGIDKGAVSAYTFSSINADHTIIATFVYVGDSAGGSKDDTPDETKDDEPGTTNKQPVIVMAEINASVSVDENGHAVATVSYGDITDAIKKALAEAEGQDGGDNGIEIVLKLNLPDNVKSMDITLQRAALMKLANTGIRQLVISSAGVTLSLDSEAINEIRAQSSGTVTISISPVSNLSVSAKNLIGSRPAYEITISHVKNGKKSKIKSLGNGSFVLNIAYKPGKNENASRLFGVYVDDNGNASVVPFSAYNESAGDLVIFGNHFSSYGVGYVKPSAKYNDTDGHRAEESIEYISGLGLFDGLTSKNFSPDKKVSRGMLATLLGRLAGADISTYKTSSFNDVDNEMYYAPYVEWAYNKGIMTGTGDGRFEPDRSITRDELAQILLRFTKASGRILTVDIEAVMNTGESETDSRYVTRAEICVILQQYIKALAD